MTDTTTATTKRADQLQPGDIIRIPPTDGTDGMTAEVRLVEPITWDTTWTTSHVVIVCVGGIVETVRTHYQYEFLDGAAAEQWRTEQAERDRRNRIAGRLEEIADAYRSGRLPLPVADLHITATMHTVDEVHAVAAALGSAALERGGMVQTSHADREYGGVAFTAYANAARTEVPA